MKTIKLFDGVQVTTKDEIKKYPDMTVFDECLNCDEESKRNIIQQLLCFHTFDISKACGGQRVILDLYVNEK